VVLHYVWKHRLYRYKPIFHLLSTCKRYNLAGKSFLRRSYHQLVKVEGEMIVWKCKLSQCKLLTFHWLHKGKYCSLFGTVALVCSCHQLVQVEKGYLGYVWFLVDTIYKCMQLFRREYNDRYCNLVCKIYQLHIYHQLEVLEDLLVLGYACFFVVCRILRYILLLHHYTHRYCTLFCKIYQIRIYHQLEVLEDLLGLGYACFFVVCRILRYTLLFHRYYTDKCYNLFCKIYQVRIYHQLEVLEDLLGLGYACFFVVCRIFRYMLVLHRYYTDKCYNLFCKIYQVHIYHQLEVLEDLLGLGYVYFLVKDRVVRYTPLLHRHYTDTYCSLFCKICQVHISHQLEVLEELPELG